MSALKRLETWGKWLLASWLAILLWRPGRSAGAGARARVARRILLVRIDNRIGEALLMTPLLRSLRTCSPAVEIHLLVHPKVQRVLDGHPDCDRVIPFNRSKLWLGPFSPALRTLRRARYEAVVDCANWTAASVTSAIVCRWIANTGVAIGPRAAPAAWFSDLPISPRADTRSEVLQRLHLLSPLPAHRQLGEMSFRPARLRSDSNPLLPERPFAVVNPGGRLGERRVPSDVFAAACQALSARGVRILVTWGPGERPLAEDVATQSPGAVLAPATDLDELAVLMRAARLTVCNNTGPMHLSVAVGTPTLAFFLRMDVERWGHSQPPHRMVDLTPLASTPQAMRQRAIQAISELLD